MSHGDGFYILREVNIRKGEKRGRSAIPNAMERLVSHIRLQSDRCALCCVHAASPAAALFLFVSRCVSS